MTDHKVVSERDWVAERKKLLEREKELTHLQEQVAAERRALPWVRVDKAYTFDTPEGKKTLSDLFDGRSQLIVYHFMYGPEMKTGCVGCSFLSDHVDGANQHLKHHDVTYVAVSRGPLATLEAYKKRMGWKFPWVSSNGNDFNHDFHVSFSKEELAEGEVDYNFRKTPAANANDELPGLSAFYKNDEGEIFHTYSSYARGPEELIGTLMILDRAPLGRNETSTMNFVRRHDEYDQPIKAAE